MITLKTGIIGSGKSLSAVEELSKLLAKWQTEAGQGERRPVYVHGIRGLALDHMPLPVYPVRGKPGDPVELDPMGRPTSEIAIDWSAVADGALVVVDECQDMFPPRGTAQKVPEHVAWLQRSRHHAVDVILITQHPRLIDSTVRAFVGKHEHYRRAFGGARAIVYEWDSVSDGLKYSTATKRLWNYPKKAFRWYKSAEAHTKQSFRIPAWIAVPILGIALGVYAVPKAAMVMYGASTGKGVAASPPAASAPAAPAPTVLAGASVTVPPPPVAASAVQHQAAASEPSGERGEGSALPDRPVALAGCVAMRDRCSCFDTDGRKVEKEPQACHTAINVAGAVLPLDVPIVRGAQDVGNTVHDVAPVPMAEIRSKSGTVDDATRSPTGSWQARTLADIQRM